MTNKYSERVEIHDDKVQVADLEVDSYNDVEELADALRAAIQRRGTMRAIARQERISNPATYGLDKRFQVRIGNGALTWNIHRIHTAGWDKNYAIAAQLSRYTPMEGWQWRTVNVERLVQTDIPATN